MLLLGCSPALRARTSLGYAAMPALALPAHLSVRQVGSGSPPRLPEPSQPGALQRTNVAGSRELDLRYWRRRGVDRNLRPLGGLRLPSPWRAGAINLSQLPVIDAKVG
jgi:hypothetical protein